MRVGLSAVFSSTLPTHRQQEPLHSAALAVVTLLPRGFHKLVGDVLRVGDTNPFEHFGNLGSHRVQIDILE